jgi:hypothetical protein
MRIAVCAETGAIDARPVIRVHADADRETESAEWIPCLAGVRVRAGDEVLLAPVMGGSSWVAIGVLATESPAAPPVRTRLPASGHEVVVDAQSEEERVQLHDDAGTLYLEVCIVAGRLLLRFPARDAVLECAGNLEVRAGERLRLTARDYELSLTGEAKTTAAGKVHVVAAEQEMQGTSGPIKLEAKKNMVINGRFILLNTKDDGKWS